MNHVLLAQLPMTGQTPAAAERRAGHTPPHPRRWLALGLLGLAQFMLVLDVTVVNVALPSIEASLHLSRAALTWVITAYALCFGGLMLFGGRSADLFGPRRVLLTGLTIFTAASLATAWPRAPPSCSAGVRRRA